MVVWLLSEWYACSRHFPLAGNLYFTEYFVLLPEFDALAFLYSYAFQ